VRISIRLFALARQRAGRPEIILDLPEGALVADLRRSLAASMPELGELLPSLLIAVDSDYARDDRPIRPENEVAIFPPVSGGGRFQQ
jgi:molybdopterin converting factor subunit 1